MVRPVTRSSHNSDEMAPERHSPRKRDTNYWEQDAPQPRILWRKSDQPKGSDRLDIDLKLIQNTNHPRDETPQRPQTRSYTRQSRMKVDPPKNDTPTYYTDEGLKLPPPKDGYRG